MLLKATSLYASLLAVVGIVLMGLVGRARAGVGVSLGDGGDRALVEANRRHMNFVENVPMALLLLALVELNGANKTWVHVLGGTLLAARIIHPFGIDATSMAKPARGIGAGGTMLVVLASAGTLLWQIYAR